MHGLEAENSQPSVVMVGLTRAFEKPLLIVSDFRSSADEPGAFYIFDFGELLQKDQIVGLGVAIDRGDEPEEDIVQSVAEKVVLYLNAERPGAANAETNVDVTFTDFSFPELLRSQEWNRFTSGVSSDILVNHLVGLKDKENDDYLARKMITGDPRHVHSTLYESDAMKLRREEFEAHNRHDVVIVLHTDTFTMAVLDKRESRESAKLARLFYLRDFFANDEQFTQVKKEILSDDEKTRIDVGTFISALVSRRLNVSRPELNREDFSPDYFAYSGTTRRFWRTPEWRQVALRFQDEMDMENVVGVMNVFIEEEQKAAKIAKIKAKYQAPGP